MIPDIIYNTVGAVLVVIWILIVAVLCEFQDSICKSWFSEDDEEEEEK